MEAPNASADRPAPAGAPTSADTLEHAVLAATRAQVWAAWCGVGVALVALVVSVVAWVNQQDLNRQQYELNRRAMDRDERVYASRVAVWAVIGEESSSILPPGLDVTVQNRSPVPLHAVRVLAHLTDPAGTGSVRIDDLPPCTILRLRLAPPPGRRFTEVPEQWLGYDALALTFTESRRHWVLDGNRLEQVPVVVPTATALLRDIPAVANELRAVPRRPEPVGDCGEGN